VHSREERRYRCHTCGKTFAATTETPFYWLHHAAEVLTVVVTMLSLGCPLQAIVVAFGLDERTVRAWWLRSGQHSAQVQTHLVQAGRTQHTPSAQDGGRLGIAMQLTNTDLLTVVGYLLGAQPGARGTRRGRAVAEQIGVRAPRRCPRDEPSDLLGHRSASSPRLTSATRSPTSNGLWR
jgi:hypothetical protein